MKNLIIKSLRWLASIIFLAWVFWRIEWYYLFQQIASANIALIFAGTFLGYGTYWIFSAMSWQTLLNAFNIPYSQSRALKLILISFFAGFALSDGIGAFTRGFYARTDGYSVKKTMLTIFIDKVAEMLGLLGFGLWGITTFLEITPKNLWFWMLGFVILGSFVVIFLMNDSSGKKFALIFDKHVLERMPLVNSKKPLSKGLSALSNVSYLTWSKVAILTFLRRLAHFFTIYILAIALGIPISFITIIAVMSIVGIVVVLPISVAGGLGVREGALIGLLSILGYQKESAISLALLIFFASLVWRIIGFIVWLKNPLTRDIVTVG